MNTHHYHYGVPSIPLFNGMHSLAQFNDAPVDRISSFFMGRDRDMEVIANTLNPRGGDVPTRYAIWGMPGLGKTQLALSYAESSYNVGRHTHVLWISATTVEKVSQQFTRVLDLLQHLDRHNPDQAARLTAARLCLEQSDEHLKWLIVLDNVTPATLQFLREHLPRHNGHGSILITTRTLEVAEAVASTAGQQCPVHRLRALSSEQSAKLLLKSAGIHQSAAGDLDEND